MKQQLRSGDIVVGKRLGYQVGRPEAIYRIKSTNADGDTATIVAAFNLHNEVHEEREFHTGSIRRATLLELLQKRAQLDELITDYARHLSEDECQNSTSR